jgi:hypothetical protein
MTDKKWQLQLNGLVVRAGSYAIRITSGPMGQSHTAQVADLKRRKEIARLISAAPEMLDALDRIARVPDCGCVPCRGQCDSAENLRINAEEIREIAQAAIRKAKGGDA